MAISAILRDAIWHPNEFRSICQYWLFHFPARDITDPAEFETSGYNRSSMKRCWEFLDATSRSFSAVIKELDGDLARVICLFYLVLRGLDTIEDDMTLPDDIKQSMMRSFHEVFDKPDWTFNGSGPNEPDRQLLVEFTVVIEEMGRIDPSCREVIVDICRKMENGMADFCHRAATTKTLYLQTIEEYDLYCHYVAGLVGEGLSRLFAATQKESPHIADQLTLSNATGMFLQKTNILRDFREDVDLTRYFWPKEIWGAHGFKDLGDLRDPARRQDALWALSGMTLDTLRHATDALDYLSLLKNQSVFNFCAIPPVMAIATLALCFMNPNVLDKNVKIRKGQAVQLIMRSTNPRDVAYMFRDFARILHAKAVPTDPYFLKISIACARIEQWAEHHYPSFIVLMTQAGNQSAVHGEIERDARRQIIDREEKLEVERKKALGLGPRTIQQEDAPKELYLFIGIAFLLVMLISFGAVALVFWFFKDKDMEGFGFF